MIIKETHAEIPLKNGLVACVDLEDVPLVSSNGWVLDDTKPNWYVHTCTGRGKNRKTLRLHRLIMQPPDDKLVDHIDGNGLNNRKSNLRICTDRQNSANSRKIANKTSKYKGVFRRESGRWRAAIRVNGKLINIGTFTDEMEAARAYNAMAVLYFGSFAWLNQLP